MASWELGVVTRNTYDVVSLPGDSAVSRDPCAAHLCRLSKALPRQDPSRPHLIREELLGQKASLSELGF